MEKERVQCKNCKYRAPYGAPYKCDYATAMYPVTRMAQPIEECTYGVRGIRKKCNGVDSAAMPPLPPSIRTRRATT